MAKQSRKKRWNDDSRNPISRWLLRHKIHCDEFVKVTGIQNWILRKLLHGERAPTTAEALRIEWATKGEIPVSAWGVYGPVVVEMRRLEKYGSSTPDMRQMYSADWMKRMKRLDEVPPTNQAAAGFEGEFENAPNTEDENAEGEAPEQLP